jgi:serine/threonine protein kinase/Tol biopolymer transport system component
VEISLKRGSRYHSVLMGLSVGDRLGRFEILGALGSGGMGDVYRARDPQLQREVAIKVLPPEWSGDPDRERRLEQEARAAASLSHPNIIAVHDFGVHDGCAFIVTELLQGETLRQRMRGRPLPARRAVQYAIQIASGLAAGHDRGTVHRDIKPENLFVTTDGLVKILDFGLARLTDPDSLVETTRTITIDGVQLGPVGGTAIYMSPEQARGLRVDHRSDIFSLGSVLYEMLAGVPPFGRHTVADTLSAILHDEPRELTAVVRVTPALERIVQHCLEKRAEDRFQNARDLIFDLQALSQFSWTALSSFPHRLATRSALVVLGVIVMFAAAAVGYVAGTRVTTPASPVASHNIRRLTELPGLEEFPSISPDGRAVAFTAGVKGRRHIFVRLLSGGAPLAITRDPADYEQPRWSPDGNSLVYFSTAGGDEGQGAIWSVPALGGSPRRLMASISGADVSKSGRLTYFRLLNGKIQLVTAALDGSDVHVVLPSAVGYHRYPRWSPDGQWIGFQRGDGVRDDIFVVAANGGEPRRLTNDRNVIGGLTWLRSSDGIVYASSRGNTVPYLPTLRLWEVRLDGSASRPITGAADASYEQPDVHDSGLVSAARLRMRFDIWQVPFDGAPIENVQRAQQITQQTGQVLTPTTSPDGDEIAFLADHGGRANLWVMSTRTGEVRQITFENDPAAAVGAPVWSPDGKAIAFVSSKGLTGLEFGVWVVNPDGSNLRNMATPGLGMSWSPDGTWLYYSDTSAGALKKVPASGGEAVVVRPEPTRNVIGLHDGTLYYMVERPLIDGRPEFEIRAASPEDGPSRLVARVPASRVPPWQIVNPAMSPDGQWLAVTLTDGFTTNIWALSTKTGEWRQVTDFGDRAIFIARRVSWSADGKSLLAAVGEGDADVALLEGLR